jgi:hypothetical protein
MLMAAIHEPVELSKGDMGIDAYTLLEKFLRFSLSVNSYKLGNAAILLDYVLYIYIMSCRPCQIIYRKLNSFKIWVSK